MKPPRVRRSLAAAIDGLVLLTLIVAAILIVGLGRSTIRFRDQAATKGALLEKLEKTVRHAIQVSSVEGTILPHSLADPILSWGLTSPAVLHDLLIVAYTPDVCVTCLQAGLASLRLWNGQGAPTIHVLVGERGVKMREQALLFREDGRMPFPVSFVPVADLERALFSHLDGEQAEEPIYLLLDRKLMIRSAFQADQLRPELLDQWLKAVSNDLK